MNKLDKILLDNALKNAIFLEQLKSGELDILQDYYREIDTVIRDVLSKSELSSYTANQYRLFLESTHKRINEILVDLSTNLDSNLKELALYQASFEYKSLSSVISEPLKQASKSSVLGYLAIAPIQAVGIDSGKVIKDVIKGFTKTETDRLVNAIKVGFAQGKTNQQIISYLRGTKANGYTDGIINVTKRSIDTAVRTLISHSANTAKDEVYNANNDVILGVKWVSTLDRRTSTICRSLDGKIFKLKEGVRPPAHPNCRSVIVPITKFSEMLSKGATRASEDGQVSADLTYYDWLKTQSVSFQDHVLGKVRGKLFRDGGLPSKRFAELQLDRNFRPITLERMMELEPLAFERSVI